KSRGYPDGMVYCKVESITYTPDGDVITDVVGQNIQLVGFLPVSQALCRKPQKKTIETVKGNWSACEVVEGDYIEFQKGKLTPTR
ncbi:MAG: hypothetical protein ACE5GN_03235, partial [Waddliaceae bacterium]